MHDIRIPLLALGPVPGLAPPWQVPFGRGTARLATRWARQIADAVAPYGWTVRTTAPHIELMITLPATCRRRIDARTIAVRDGISTAIRAGFAAGTGHVPALSQIAITITYDTATVDPHGDTALCMRRTR